MISFGIESNNGPFYVDKLTPKVLIPVLQPYPWRYVDFNGVGSTGIQRMIWKAVTTWGRHSYSGLEGYKIFVAK